MTYLNMIHSDDINLTHRDDILKHDTVMTVLKPDSDDILKPDTQW